MSRRPEILRAIVKMFIQTASPVGSKVLKESENFTFSPATLRNEMAKLEEEGYLTQTHTSSGRVPTSHGYRFFVDNLSIPGEFKEDIFFQFKNEFKKYLAEKKADEAILDIVSVITKMTPNIAFATIPSNQRTFFLGFSKMLQQPEFQGNSNLASGVFRILEEDFYDLLQSMDISSETQVFIGRENVIAEMESCAMVVSRFETFGKKGFFGILGPMRMDYAHNISIIESAKKYI